MREIKFRGKSVETGEWVYGSLVQEAGKSWIVGGISIEDAGGVFDFYATEWYEVIPETVGQYTSLKDMDREEIFEGAIGWDERGEVHGKVVFDEGGFLFEWENMSDDLFECCGDLVIVGNIYDNPELLEVAK
ncbi:YopX family protein [Carnobacterium maltaromaticum]|uniref:YopX family protein n=1 Tax=Carnobacterium maltaromaticum TaxID=2751 RepID=UPI00165C4D3E|nr:YopX family protein [Carnobacterium maltaromaticum]MBC9808163.1 hypothetical protein [Carnobacterium maltaromaticum]